MSTPATADRAARERILRRSKAVAAAASFGGFASLVAVLIAHPAHATTNSTNTSTSSSTGRSTSTDDGSDGFWFQSGSSNVVPDTVTHSS
jgi:uncharacterized membrane protein